MKVKKLLNNLKGNPIEIIRVGIISTAQYFLPQVLKQFRAKHSAIIK